MAYTQRVRLQRFSTTEIDLRIAIEAFLAFCQAKNLSGNTLTYYRYRLCAFRKHFADTFPDMPVSAFTPQQIREFVASEAKKSSPSTANHSITTLRAFFNYLVRDGFVESSPMAQVDKLRSRKTIIETFSKDQIEAILGTCGKDFIGVRDRALILLLFDCGLRASEAASLLLDGSRGLIKHCWFWARETRKGSCPSGRPAAKRCCSTRAGAAV